MTAIPAPVRNRLTARLASDHCMSPARASRAVDDMTRFLARCAAGGTHSPEPDADLAWHEFILRTQDYAAYCGHLGVFVHHVPAPGSCGGVSCTNGDCTSGGPPAVLTDASGT